MTDQTDMETDVETGVATALDRVRRQMLRAGGGPLAAADVTLIAVSKTFGPTAVTAALRAGQRVFGENRVQEAAGKWLPLRQEWPDVELHLIGPLQTNKVRQALAVFDCIGTLDRPVLAAALAREMDRAGRRIPCFIQVNTGEEPQKAGILPIAADTFIAACRTDYDLPVAGLMCIPPAGAEPAPHFALLRKIAVRNGLRQLSMGMSSDFETAIRLGATHVRLGSAVFGTRAIPGLENYEDRAG